MFAVLSWLQESSILSKNLGWTKGFYAVVSGFFYTDILEVDYN